AAGARVPHPPPAAPAGWSSSPGNRFGPALPHIGRSRAPTPGPAGRPPGTTAPPEVPPTPATPARAAG
ncbi:Helix-turn-helix conjugative transposon-like domain-containing protein, partial [Dysosmobacter welbionis]